MYDFVWKPQGGNEHHVFLDRTLIATVHFVIDHYYIQYKGPEGSKGTLFSEALRTRYRVSSWLNEVHTQQRKRIEK